jgi:site-specific recombinase XerD
LHTLRHTFASRLVKEGTDLYAVSKLLGHKSIKMTERYSHLAPSKLGKVVSILNSSLSAVAA